MSILITGSSGLIGTALIDRLREQGRGVTRLVRDQRTSVPGTTDVRWDPAAGTIDEEGLERAGPFDGVVHLAGAGIGDRRWTPARKKVVHDSRTGSTQLLVGALLQLPTPPPALVSGSAVGFYGDRGDEELTEVSSVGTGFLAGLCRTWEHAAEPATDAGIRTVLLRTGIVISGHGGVLGKQLPLFRLGLGGRTGTGRQYRSWITIEDEIGVILRCLDDDRLSGPVNATSPAPATDAELAKALGAALHRPTVLSVPASAIRLALGSEMAGELVLAGQRVLPSVLMAHDHRFVHTDLTEAVRSVLEST